MGAIDKLACGLTAPNWSRAICSTDIIQCPLLEICGRKIFCKQTCSSDFLPWPFIPLIIFASSAIWYLWLCWAVFSLVSKNRPEITLFFDGSEWNYTGTSNASIALSYGLDDKRRYKQEPWMNEEMLDYCKWYLKRECYPEDVERGAIPFTYGCENSMFRNYNNLND